MAQTPEYIQWPGTQTFPGEHSTPGWDDRADGAEYVHSHKGWVWQYASNEYQEAVAGLAQSAIESAVQRSATAFGKVFYIKGGPDTVPDFPGEAVGDTTRVQDYVTLNIVAEYRWNGASWEKTLVSGTQISNLDVGRLTAGSAAINELAARKIASDVGRFLELTTEQLTVSGTASFNKAIAKEVWSQIVHARAGEFEKITAGMLDANNVTASKVLAGAIDGQVITGATIRTAASGARVEMDRLGIRANRPDGYTTFSVDAATGEVFVDGAVGMRDTWSWCRFQDVRSAENKDIRDTPGGQVKFGVGLVFNRFDNPWKYSGGVRLEEHPGVGGTIRMQAPANDEQAVSVVINRDHFQVNTAENTFYLSGPIVNIGNENGRLSINPLQVALGRTTSGLRLDTNTVHLQGLVNGSTCSLTLNTQVAHLAYNNSNYLQVNSSGVHQVGGKNFVMQVPRVTKEKNKVLVHASTESPWDGIEYWDNIILDGEGNGSWDLPDYVPLIASQKAPRSVFATADKGQVNASLDDSGDLWTVSVQGSPGARVSVLVKLARIVEEVTGDDGYTTKWRDNRPDLLWQDRSDFFVPTPTLPGDNYDDSE